MARSVSDWLRDADSEARRWVLSQRGAAERECGWYTASTFAKFIARGNVPAPTPPEDEKLVRVGWFILHGLNDIQRRALASHYGDTETEKMKARRIGVTVGRFRHLRERALTGLAGYLMAFR
jgi:hypothetical protein